MRRAAAVTVVLLASLLLGALAAGTPVAGNDTVAATTAGIELGTAPAARSIVTATAPHRVPIARALVLAIEVLLAGTALWVLLEAPVDARSSDRLRRGRAWTHRGPPAPA